MRELTILREVHRRQAAEANGRHVHNPTHQDVQAKFAGYELDLMTMPVDTTDQSILQNPDGSFVFMLGFSALSGDDTLG